MFDVLKRKNMSNLFNQKPVSESLATAIACCKQLNLEELHDLSKQLKQADEKQNLTWAGAITLALDRKFDKHNELLSQN